MKDPTGTDSKDPKRRDSALPSELRDLEKLVLAFAEEFPFASDQVERLRKKTAGVIAAWRLREGRFRAEHHTSRAYLNGLTKGGIERWIASSGDADMQSHFRRVWREDATVAPTGKTPVTPAAVQGAAQPEAAKPSFPAAAAASTTTVTK